MSLATRLLGALAFLALVSSGALAAAVADGVAGLEVGQRVEVKGSFLPDGVLLADEIEVRREDDQDEELRGNVSQLDVETRTLRMLGFEVHVPADTEIIRDPSGRAALEELVPGLRIKVDGQRDEEGRFVARKIRIRESQYKETKLVGAIESIDAAQRGFATLKLVGVTVLLNEATDFIGVSGVAQPILRRRIGVIDDEDVQLGGRYRLGKNIAFGGEVRLRYELLDNLDLGDEGGLRESVPEITGLVGAAGSFGRLFAYAEIEAAREYFLEGGEGLEGAESRGRVEVGEAYIEYQGALFSNVSVAIGRQKFNEEREWFYNNKNLDAVRLLASWSNFGLEASISRNIFDESSNVREQEKTNVIVKGSWIPDDDLLFEAYLIERRDRTESEDSPRFLGLRAMGELGRHVEFWADGAYQAGERGQALEDGAVRVRDVRAHAYDLGLTLRPRWRWDPTLTVGYAFASGGDEEDPEEDETFTPTGLQRYRDRWNGVVSFRYYGEVVDPDLSNMRISTIALGFRPTRAFSVDLIYHGYDQDVASRRLFETDLEERPLGEERELGEEIDLALGYEPTRRFELRLTAGRFWPGAAYSDDASPASIVRFQAKFRF